MADYKGLTIKFGADDSGLSAALKRIDDDVKYTQQNLKTLQEALKLDPKSTKLLSDAFKVAENNAKAWGNEVATLKTKIKDNNEVLRISKDKLAELERAGRGASDEYKLLASEVAAFEGNLETANIELDIAKARLTDAENVQKAWGTQVEASKTGVYQFGQNLTDAGGALTGVGDALLDVGTKLTVFSTMAAVTFGKEIIANTEEFGNQISRLGGYLGIEGDNLELMSDLALYWGKETVFSAVEAAEAMNELAKGGLTEAEIKAGALEAALSIAAAGGISMADAADIAVQTMRTFNMEAGDAASIADALAGAANASTAEIGDLSAGFVNVGGMARLAGWDVHDVSGALALMADNGYSGAVAGTALKVMLQRLAAPTEKAAGVMDDLGINVRDAEGHMKPATEIVKLFTDATAELSDEERDAALQTIFGTRAINAILALMNSGSGTLQKYIEATEKEGYAAEMAQSRLGDLGWALELLRGEAETASVNLGQSLTPIVIDLANAAEDAFGWFNELTEAERDNVVQAGLTAFAAGPLIAALGGVLKVAGGAATALGDGLRFLSLWHEAGKTGAQGAERIGLAMADLAGDADHATRYIAGAESALGGLKVMIGLAGAAIVALMAYELWKYFDGMRENAENADEATHSLKDTLDAFDATAAQEDVDDLSGSLDGLAGSYGDVLKQHNELADKIREKNLSAALDIAEWERVRSVIEEFGSATRELSDSELGELEYVLKKVNDELGTSYQYNSDLKQIVDEEGVAVENLTEKLNALIDARVAGIKQEAYADAMKGIYEQQAEEAMLLAEKERELQYAIENRQSLLNNNETSAGYKLASEQAAQAAHYWAVEEKRLRGEIEGMRGAIEDSEATLEIYKSLYHDATVEATEANNAVADFSQTVEEAARNAHVDELFETGEEFDAFIADLELAGVKTSDFVNLTGEEQSNLVAAWQDTSRDVVTEFAFMSGRLDLLGDDWAVGMAQIMEDTGMYSDEIAAALKEGIESGALSYSSGIDEIIGYIEQYEAKEVEPKVFTAIEEPVEEAVTEGISDIDRFNLKETFDKNLKAIFDSINYTTTFGDIDTFNREPDHTWYGRAEFSENGWFNDTINKISSFLGIGSASYSYTAAFDANLYQFQARGGIRTHADGGIRYHADGGAIVNVPKYGYPLDLVGEAGAEAIVPLTNRRYSQPFVDMITSGIIGKMPHAGGVTVNVGNITVREDADIDRIATALNSKIERARGGAL